MKTGDLAIWNDGCTDYLVLVTGWSCHWNGWNEVQAVCGGLRFQVQAHDLHPIK